MTGPQPLHRPRAAARKPTAARPGRHVRPSRPAYLRRKLTMSQPQDAEEREADAVASAITRSASNQGPVETEEMISSTPVPAAQRIHRQAEEEEPIQAKLKPSVETEQHEDEALSAWIARETVPPDEDTSAAPLRRQVDENETEETLQTWLARHEDEMPEIDEEEAGAESDTGRTVAPDIEAAIERLAGTGAPLPAEVREDMEARFGADFSQVGIHTGAEAAALNSRLHARAFAVGNDIFFAPGEFSPQTEAGRELLAHELTHVVQQSSGTVQRLYRNGGGGTGSSKGTYHRGEGYVDLPRLPYPSVPKIADSHYNGFLPLIRHRGYSGNRSTQQNTKWFGEIGLEGAKTKLQDAPGYSREGAAGRLTFVVPSPHQRIAQRGRNASNVRYLMGSLEEIARDAARPTWTPQGRPAPLNGRRASYEIDHLVEAQVGAQSARGGSYVMKPAVDSMANYALLKGEKNQAKGTAVKNSVERQLTEFLRGNEDDYRNKPFSQWNAASLKHRLSLEFASVTVEAGMVRMGDNDVWTKGEIESGAHIDALLNANQVRCLSLSELEEQVPDGHLWIFHSRQGGLRVDLNKNQPRRDFLKPFRLHEDSEFHAVDHPTDETDLATLYFSLQPNNRAKLKPMEKSAAVRIKSLNGSSKLGHFENGRVAALLGLRRQAAREDDSESSQDGNLQLAGQSPIQVEGFDLTGDGLAVTGKIVPTLSVFENAFIDFELLGDQLTLSKTFLIDEINVPPPFSIEQCSITLSGGTGGFALDGGIEFAIDGLGEGSAEAGYHSRNGAHLRGRFDFDERIFGRGTDARIRFAYEQGAWVIGGTVTIPSGKVPGINSATIEAEYAQNSGFSAQGQAELGIPGVESGTLAVRHSEEEGLSIGGRFNLSGDVPGIRSGHVEAELQERPDGSGYALNANGEAVPDIPGFSSKLTVSYHDGLITAEAQAAYQRGMLDGQVRAGVTNRRFDADGNPTDEVSEELTVYGGGTVTLKLAPWLQATAGIRFEPNGEVTVSGEIGIPNALDIFDRREFDKSLLNIAVQVPIVTGVVAEIGGGLSAKAGIGPGKLERLSLGIEYNPAREEDTHVTGRAHLRVPADAGLRLSVRAGIGLSIVAASATGGLDVGGTLGIEGAAEADVHVDWTPSEGLDLRTRLSVHAQPSFTFDIGGYVSVRALRRRVYDKRWQFAEYRFGSDYRFGIALPIHYHEGEPFDISLDDVEFTVPDINPRQLLRGLINRIK
ncbi:DUF4157 domain-containing protein [Halomonas sp. BM-2019]|uniref:eCIS core domain-containing protein n=1 Tax=Halomonas sp. BM-2019 TaxID=2811227 RepID=UPI001B3C3E4B|nr:MAG: DUF4157 domain-containing protein [Halomonas sp. BM-2019]